MKDMNDSDIIKWIDQFKNYSKEQAIQKLISFGKTLEQAESFLQYTKLFRSNHDNKCHATYSEKSGLYQVGLWRDNL